MHLSFFSSDQILASLAPHSADPRGYWQKCRLNYAYCSSSQIQVLQGGLLSLFTSSWLYASILASILILIFMSFILFMQSRFQKTNAKCCKWLLRVQKKWAIHKLMFCSLSDRETGHLVCS